MYSVARKILNFSMCRIIVGRAVVASLMVAYMVPSFATVDVRRNVVEEPQQLVRRLQNRFDSQVSACPDGSVAWHCSGLIIHSASENHPFTLSPTQIKVGVASFSYVRRDNMAPPYGHQGILLKPDFEFHQIKTAVACFYPMNAGADDNIRAPERHQCSELTDDIMSPGDYSSCYALLGRIPKDTPPDTWIAHFKAKYGEAIKWTYKDQCSFSTSDPSQFIAAIKLSKEIAGMGRFNNELILTPWGASPTDDIPAEVIEAVWYDINAADPVAARSIAEEFARKLYRKGVEVYPVGIDFKKGIVTLAK
ncbi:hypothetical protein [Paraburkholderia aspalathi]|uniref:hypothetical protein n=1 Tax=Paraburkholderia aspalathi TaxID=1324617 RepID=UPI0038BA43E3